MTRVPCDADACKIHDRARLVLERELLRDPDEVCCPLPRRERRVEAHRAAGRFYAELGDPQQAYPAIHVAGSSGKGSTAWTIAHLLRHAGLRVGLHLSPYLQVPTEKVWVDGRFVSAADWAAAVGVVAPVARRFRSADSPAPIHGMASAAVAFECFRRARVDAAVIEASCGGRYDVTSHLDTRVAVITTVSRDHLDVLGPRAADVPFHKAGVLRRGAAGVTGARGRALDGIRAEARRLGVRLIEIPGGRGPIGVAARATAEAAVRAFGVEPRAGAIVPPLAARLERMPGRARTILDAAHSPEKVRGLLRSLPAPDVPEVLLFGALRGKQAGPMLRLLSRRFRAVVFAEAPAAGKPAVPASVLAARYGAWFDRSAADASPLLALARARRLAGPDGTVVVAGSVYLAGALRGRWYPDAQVLLQRTFFPRRR
jgi:dihydrofolate synthase/folylpolyglutamate synthase